MTKPRYLGRVKQGIAEEFVYTDTTTKCGSSPTDPSVVAYDVTTTTWIDVSSTVLDGSPSVSGDVITLPKVKNLTVDHRYRFEVTYTIGSNVFVDYFLVVGER